MKKILVTAAGTGTAWHISKVYEEFYRNEMQLFLCDAGDLDLIPCAKSAEKIFKVPKCSENMVENDEYFRVMSDLIISEKIDAIIPLIDAEAYMFSRDAEFVIKNNLFTSAPKLDTVETVHDKKHLSEFLEKCDIPTPCIIEKNDINNKIEYVVKPRRGYGSANVCILYGTEIKHRIEEENDFFDNYIIQEYCRGDDYQEVTVEVFKFENITKMFARRRIAVKSGVCTKMEPVAIGPFSSYVEKIISCIDCPIAFNLQFLFHDSKWKLYDFNIRLPAGTAMSTAIGFQLTRALLAVGLEKRIEDDWFEVDRSVKNVLRVYQEIIVR